jgi:hypothetical protein
MSYVDASKTSKNLKTYSKGADSQHNYTPTQLQNSLDGYLK